MSILTQAIDESRRKREQAGGQERKSVLRQAIDQARQGGPGVTLPTARQGTVSLPRADQGMGDAGTASPAPIGPNPGSLAGAVRGTALAASGQGRETGRESPAPHSQGAVLPTASSLIQRPPFVPDSAASRVPSLGARNMDVVQREIDGVDSVIQKLRERQNELDGQARLLDNRVDAWGRLGGAGSGGQFSRQAAQLHGQAREVGKAIAQMEGSRAGLQAEWEQADEQEFNRVRQTAGFRAAVDKAMGSPIGVVTANSRNPSHYDVSSAMTYFQAKARGEERLAEAAKGSADMALDRMSKAQQERLAYYVGMGDYDGAAAYLNRIAPALNRAEAENLEQGIAEWAQKHPVQGAMTNIVSWPLNIPAYFANAGQAAKNLVTGKDEQDPHASAYGLTRIGTGTAQGTQEAARSAATQAFGSETAGDVAAFLTGTGLSIGQNAAQIALLGPGSLAAMSMSAAGGSTEDALERGATPGQALALGTANGLTEALTEKLPLDNLFRLAKEGGSRGVKATVMELLKQMGTEASEEAISEIAGNLADAVIMGDKSELNAYVRELQEAGMSQEDAQRAAALKFYGANVGLAALGGGISGGVMGGGALTFHRAGELAQRLNAGKQGSAQINAAIDQAYQAMVEKGMFSQEAGQAIASAQDEIGNDNPLLSTGERAVDVREGVVPATTGEDAARGAQGAAETMRADGGIITPQAGQTAPQGARSAVPGQNEAALAGGVVRGGPVETEVKDQRANVPESDTGAGRERWLDGLQDTVRQLREDYAQGKIDDAAFDGMMDAIEEQAALEGMERSEVWKRLDGDMGGLTTKGAEYGTDEQRTAAPGGQQLFDRGAGRDIDAGAGGQAGGVEGGGSQRAADPGRAAAERGNLGKSLRLEAVSSRELGLANGTDARTVQVLPETAWDGELRDTARKVRRETGLGIRFVLGGIQVTGSDGEAHQVRGVYGRDGIIVQADNLRVSPKQIADHEIFHSYADGDPGLIQAAEDAIVERYGQEEFDGVVTEYLMRLRGIIDVPESGTMDDLAFAQAVAEAKNEVLADAFAGINAFGTQAAKYQEAVYDTLEDRGTAAPRGRENAQAMDSRRGPPAEQFSFEGRTEDGIEVYETSEEIKRLPYKQRVAAFLELMRGEYRGRTAKFTAGDGQVYYARFSGKDLSKNVYGDKRSSSQGLAAKINMGAGGDIFDLVENAQYAGSRSESGKSSRAHGGVSSWDYFVKTIQIDGQLFDLLANVRKKLGGEYVYSIQLNESMKKTPAPSLASSHSTNSDAQDRMLTGVSNESIAQPAPIVKSWDGTLPRGTDGSVTLPGGVSDSDTAGTGRFSVDDNSVFDSGTFEDGITLNKGGEAIDGSMLPTLAEVQTRKTRAAQEAQENAGDVSDSDTVGQTPEVDIVEALPAKARDYLQRAERRLMNRIGELLSVPKSAQREFLQDIVRNISAEYLSTGQVSQKTRDQLFERAYEQGVIVDREYYDTYKHVRDYLRTTPIMVSEWLKGDIDDYNEWRKGAFGTLRLVKKGGIGPDAAYMELQHMAPGLFPDSITHPADQLRHILEAAKGIRASERSLNEAYGPDAAEFKRWSRRDFDEAVAEALGELKQVKRYADERAQQAQARQEARTPMTVQETAALYGQMRGAQRVYQRASARNLLTQHDEIQVGRLLRGELELEHLDPAKDNVRGITAVYEAKREYEELAGRIREWNQQRKAALREQADGFLENANQWKDKPAGILYSRETMERNIRDIVPDRELADRINKAYFQPVYQAAAEANKTKNQYRDRVRALNLSRKAAKGDAVSEAHAVQLLGEAEDNIRWLEDRRGRMEKRDGKTLEDWRGVVQNLWKENPGLDQKKIRDAVEEFRAIYDELFQQMNEARVRNGYEPVSYRQGYFPHFQVDSEGLIAQFGRALGIETAVTNLPTTINGLTHTFKPGIRYFSHALSRKGFDTAYDAVQGFDRYIEGAADVIHQTDNIQALRALGAQARYRTGDEGLRQQVEKVQANEELTDQEKQALIDEIYKDGRFTLSNFVVELDEYTNLLANKKSRADRNMEQALGRRMYNIVKGLESRVAANMVAVNPASWLTNFVPLTQGWGAVHSKYMLKGMWDTLKAYKADDGMVGMSSFLTNRRGSDPIVKTWSQSASAVLSSPMEYIDQFTADSLIRARFAQNVDAGMSEAAAMEEADAWAAGVMADRSKGATPTLFNRSNPLTKVFTQFQLEVNNQLSYLFKDLPRDVGKKGLAALCAALLKFCLGAYLYNEVYEFFVGRRCALDPIGILNDTVGDFTGYQIPNVVGMAVDAAQGKGISFETERKSTLEAAAGLGKSVAEELPFAGGVLGGGRVPISSALPDWGNLAKAALNDSWSGEKRAATAAKELGKPLTYVLPPFGGGQIKKIYQGLKTVAEGGSYTVDNKGNDILQYPVFNETLKDGLLTLPTALTFGKSALPTAREWAERGFKSMNAKQTACYQGMTELGVPQRDAYQLLQDLGGVEAPAGEDVPATERAMYQKRKLLQKADISAQGKGVVYYTLFASDKERELMDGLGDKGEAARVLMELKDAGAEHKGAEMSAAKKKAIMGSSLGEEEKDAIFRYVLGKDSKGAGYSQTFAAAGLDKRTAAAAANALNGLTPEEGRKTVSDAQKWRAVLGAVKDTQGQKAALLAVMGDSARTRYEVADSFGIQPEAWVQLKEALPQFDENGNGSYSGAEIEKAIDALGGDGSLLAPWDKEPLRLSREEKAVLWQLFTGNKSGSGNPYSTRVGRQAAKALEEAKEEE